MATRRRGGADLDDLKARLGYGSSSAEPPNPDNAVAPPADDDDLDEVGDDAEPESFDAPAASPDPAPAAPSASSPAAPAFEDYSEAVSNVESAAPIDYDANAVDPDLSAPGSKSLAGVAIAAVVALVVGIAFGAIGSTANFVRKLDNAITDDAATARSIIEPRTTRIRELHLQIQDLDTDRVNADFEAHLRTAMADGELGASAALLGQLNALMGYDENMSRELVAFVVASNHVSRLVQRHLTLTERDRDELDRLMAGAADNRSFGIAVGLESMIARYQAFVEDPAANPFTPIPGERVTYESLEMIVEGEGDEQREFYAVQNVAGETIRVAVHDLISVDRSQLLPPSSNETALDRYAARATSIKEAVAELVTMQSELMSDLDTRASQPKHTTL